jgi:hypothetical protein
VGPGLIFLARISTNTSKDIEKLLEELQKQNAEQRELLNNLSESEPHFLLCARRTFLTLFYLTRLAC